MSFQDAFKSSFLDNFTEVSLVDIIIAMVFAFAVGAFIYFIYRKTFQGVMYSSGFGITLIGLTMVTTLVILAVTSNVMLSLGMVGALSIVRFRAAIKEPFEIVFLFWSLAAGIVIGADMYLLVIVGSLLIGLVMILFAKKKIGVHPYILIVNYSGAETESAVMAELHKKISRVTVKAKTVSAAGTELTVELRLADDDTAFVSAVSALPGVTAASLVTYNGQFAD